MPPRNIKHQEASVKTTHWAQRHTAGVRAARIASRCSQRAARLALHRAPRRIWHRAASGTAPHLAPRRIGRHAASSATPHRAVKKIDRRRCPSAIRLRPRGQGTSKSDMNDSLLSLSGFPTFHQVDALVLKSDMNDSFISDFQAMKIVHILPLRNQRPRGPRAGGCAAWAERRGLRGVGRRGMGRAAGTEGSPHRKGTRSGRRGPRGGDRGRARNRAAWEAPKTAEPGRPSELAHLQPGGGPVLG